MCRGKFFGIGVGPGDPELLTLKAVRVIKNTGVLAVPKTNGNKNVALDIVSKAIDISKKEILYLNFPMVKDKSILKEAHEENATKIADILNKGMDVAFLTLGDVSIYSTFSYVHRAIEKMGYDTEICAGVPSFCAVAAKLKVSLTSMKKPLHIIPAVHGDIKKSFALEGTKVFMKAGGNVKNIAKAAEHKGFCVLGISDCGMESERQIVDFENDEFGYFTTIVVKEGEK
ncbi:MAG: precorrin-2 C(20)-methyltransferase [Lachnospiraceae bacterium]|nr:precorrin-2 C(20)-methyltransferase [Lachnospiraceae bacterium]